MSLSKEWNHKFPFISAQILFHIISISEKCIGYLAYWYA